MIHHLEAGATGAMSRQHMTSLHVDTITKTILIPYFYSDDTQRGCIKRDVWCGVSTEVKPDHL